jgi:rhodanese-related sulfurtransferase
MPAVVKHHIRTSLVLLVAVACATQGCAMLRRRAAERPPYRKVSPPIAYEIIRDTPNLLILDLRPPGEFHGDTGHIYRAYNIPEDQLPYRLLELSSFREETFLVYCDSAKCGDAGMAVLVSSGFENAILIDGGIDGWIAKGFRTVLPAELAGKRQQASHGEAAGVTEEEESAAVAAAAQPALQQVQQGTAGATAPVLCPEPHVSVQKPPR